MKTGIAFADAVTTVSPTYAHEITEPEHGCALDGTLRDRGQSLIGIVNGVDYSHWNPAIDPYLTKKFDFSNWQEGKAACKLALQAAHGLSPEPNTPLIGIIGPRASRARR